MNQKAIELPGYQINEQIYSGQRTLVYRGVRLADGEKVVVKLMRSEYPTFAQLVQFRHQYVLTKDLTLPGLVQSYNLESYQNNYALIMEDFGGISLSQYLQGRALGLGEFFSIGISIINVVEQLHQARIIHKDLKPANILINPDTKIIKLVDFSIASALGKETKALANIEVLEGTLAYISPEQTGRMNRGIDYRSDLYSLGVTFYELLTGQLPFVTTDPLELVHCHLAKYPPLPSIINPHIPPILEQIINKLMAKNAEDRYQSEKGLKADLEFCLQQWERTGNIPLFSLGKHDKSAQFMISEKLYGREQDVQAVLAAFDRVSAGAKEMIMVAGYSGIGKTAIVNEVGKPLVAKRGYFTKGKFDQFQSNIPLMAIIEAFKNLLEQFLSESDAKIEQWCHEILEAVGDNGQVIIDVIPELELLIGPQPAVPELDSNAAQNRFNLVFRNFFAVLTGPEHPLVLFLDDLQWADSVSLNFLQLLMGDRDLSYLLLIGAYRDNEVFPSHPLILTLEDLAKTGTVIQTRTLAPLNFDDLNQLVADSLKTSLAETTSLTELIAQKTQGNPFFSGQILKSLFAEGAIFFNNEIEAWQFDFNQVHGLSLYDDVVDFMAKQLQKLPESSLKTLQLAACIGHQFDLETLGTICEQSTSATVASLWPALEAGWIIPTSDLSKFYHETDHLTENPGEKLLLTYQFLHDRVQQSAYRLIPEAEKQATHWQIGQLLLAKTPPDKQEEKLFEIVNQLNIGYGLNIDPTLDIKLAELNFKAGKKAKESTAYPAAIAYLQKGQELLKETAWIEQYDLTLAMHIVLGEAAYLSGNLELMEGTIAIVTQQAQNLLDQIPLRQTQITALSTQGRFLEAIEIGLGVLHDLGIDLPTNPTNDDFAVGLAEVNTHLSGQNIENLVNWEIMTDPRCQGAMQILARTYSAAYIGLPALMPLVVFKMVVLSLQYGNTSQSPFAYGLHGLLLCAVVGDINTGYQFGQLAFKLLEKLNVKALQAKIYNIFGLFIQHWQEPLEHTIPQFKASYKSGLETGDLEFGGFSLWLSTCVPLLLGSDLEEVEADMAKTGNTLALLKQQVTQGYHNIHWQTALNLLNRAPQPWELVGEVYNENLCLHQHQKNNDVVALCFLFIFKAFLCYIFGKDRLAVENITQAEPYLAGLTGMFFVPMFYFYDSLARLAIASELTPEARAQTLEKVAENQAKTEKWAASAPMNYGHQYYLVEAEKYRVLGDKLEAIELYDQAISLAQENQYPNDEAIACERAALFYLNWGRESIAQTYLTKAYYAYGHWGAIAKIKDLEKRYTKLLAPLFQAQKIKYNLTDTLTHSKTASITTSSTVGEGTTTTDFLDLATVLKVSQALAKEIKLEHLLSTLMQAVMENVGASKGVLLLSQGKSLTVEALGMIAVEQQSPIITIASIPVEECPEIPLTMIRYVQRSQESIVSQDVKNSNRFSADLYFSNNQPQSLLCLPIASQSKLIGILYLENQLAKNAFTVNRLEMLNILVSQAAISLENAQLYHTLEDKVKQRTAQLAQANEEINSLNEKLKDENIRLGAELDILRKMQQMILPKETELAEIEELDIAGFMEPAEEVGGDYYDVLAADGVITIGIGDVTGHGLESGILMVMTQAAVRTLKEGKEGDRLKFLDTLNRTIYKNVQRINTNKSITLAILNYLEGTVSITGQHEEVIVARANGDIERFDTIDLGMPLGLDEDITQFINHALIQLNPGDGIVLYTDGITEAIDLRDRDYGLDRLCQVVSNNWSLSAQEITEAVIGDVRQFIGEQKHLDDWTLLVLKQK